MGTLVYIFYSMPRDVLQAHSAQELYAREWRYHRDRKLWFRRESGPGEGAGATAAAAPPTYAYWDVTAWEKRAYTGPVAALVQGFLPEEEVKIRRLEPAVAAAQQAQAQQVQAAAQATAHA